MGGAAVIDRRENVSEHTFSPILDLRMNFKVLPPERAGAQNLEKVEVPWSVRLAFLVGLVGLGFGLENHSSFRHL